MSEAVSAAALDPAVPVDIDSAENKAGSTGVVNVTVIMIDDVGMVECTFSGAAVEDGSVNAVVIAVAN